jgi:hypothetical protein
VGATRNGRTPADPTGVVSHVFALAEVRAAARYRFKDYDEIVADLIRLEVRSARTRAQMHLAMPAVRTYTHAQAEFPQLVRLYTAQAEYNLTTIEQWTSSATPLCGKSVCKQWIVTITVRMPLAATPCERPEVV